MPSDCHSESFTQLGYCLYINLQFITGLFSFGDFVQPLHLGCVHYNLTDTAYALAFSFCLLSVPFTTAHGYGLSLKATLPHAT